MAKKFDWYNIPPLSEEDVVDESVASSAEPVQAVPGWPLWQVEESDASKPGTSSGTRVETKAKKSYKTAPRFKSKPGTSSPNLDHREIQNIPVVDAETGRMYKAYEVLMNKLGVEVPELAYDKLRDVEKIWRKSKENVVIFFEEVNEEDETLASNRSAKQIWIIVDNLCHGLTGKEMSIKSARMIPCPIPGTVMTKVKFYNLEDKKEILANKELLIGTEYSVDHDLTKTEVHLQSQLLKLWRKKEDDKNFMLRKKTKVQVNNRWVTIRPLRAESTSESAK